MNNNLKKINIYAIYLGAIILILPLIAFFINVVCWIKDLRLKLLKLVILSKF